MDWTVTHLSYKDTRCFPKLMTDYLEQSASLRNFYEHEASIDGFRNAVEKRKLFKTNRELLVTELRTQYSNDQQHQKVLENISALQNENTFTICTAHQPNIFTGHLYFIYKILHVISLSAYLTGELKPYRFIPVFYMGSEDADLEELGNIWLNGQKLNWDTEQSGAVGRMKTTGLEKLIDRIEGELDVYPHGKELVQLLRRCYLESENIQMATFKLVNDLFGSFGLLVMIPDNGRMKRLMEPIFQQDILEQKPSEIVGTTIGEMQDAGIKVQANPREINLFYLKENLRERVTQNGGGYYIHNTPIKFSKDALLNELKEHPDHFSPNVILRGLYQETILPNVSFVGGAGELSYWLELKSLFKHYKVPFPVLVLRNSFLIIEKKWKEKMNKLGISEEEIFYSEKELLDAIVKKHSGNQLELTKEKEEMERLYKHIEEVVSKVDKTLAKHTEVLATKALKRISELEKKILKAEKTKFNDEQRQLHTLKEALFPGGNLQERVENFMPFYAKWGNNFMKDIYENSLNLEQMFTVLSEKI